LSRYEEGRANANVIRTSVGAEIRLARTSAGARLRDAGRRAGMSHMQLSRIERGVLERVSVDELSRACSGVGLKLVARAIPDAGPAVDAGQLRLLGRFRLLLPDGLPVATEVPLPIPGDRRAWDAMITLERLRIAIEAETRLRDLQALERRYQLKLRDGNADRLILVVSDTANNRGMLDAYREVLRGTFPLDGRQIIPALRAGRAPAANGIIVL
jgi:transcriptional regulator with XRE-family HTH domain